MPSIKIMNSHKNLIFAAKVANSTGATFTEDGSWIVIEDSPTLEIPRYDFDEVFDPEGKANSLQIEAKWGSLILNKVGSLKHFDDQEIVLEDK